MTKVDLLCYYYYYYFHIFPDYRAQHCNYATLPAGRSFFAMSLLLLNSLQKVEINNEVTIYVESGHA